MSHSPTIRAITRYADDAIKQKDPLVFLQEFGPLHNRWHTTSLRNNVGFLLFHWHVVTAFKRCHADKIWPGGVHAFSLADWKRFDWPFKPIAKPRAGNFDSLAGFSSAIENWHNEAHMAVQMATGEDLMNPSTNVLLRNFWRLHYFIDARFLEALAAFDGAGPVDKQISRLEKKYDSRLGEV
jgi:hypothetical protein